VEGGAWGFAGAEPFWGASFWQPASANTASTTQAKASRFMLRLPEIEVKGLVYWIPP
jgi:hypothetical protein